MPELPEAETIVRQLKSKIENKKIIKIEVLDSKIVNPKIIILAPNKFEKIWRKAKAIVMQISNQFLVVRLGMTGYFQYFLNQNIEPNKLKFAVAKFYMQDGSLLTYNEVRKFGGIDLFDQKGLDNEFSKYGPEPLENNFNLDTFVSLMSKKKNSVLKTTLMDQHFISGIGNIYAQEVLYNAKINPKRKISSLNFGEIKRVYENIRFVLNEAIKHNGSTVENYTSLDGAGNYQVYHKVYQKKKCPLGHNLKNLIMGGRNTFYCPICQK